MAEDVGLQGQMMAEGAQMPGMDYFAATSKDAGNQRCKGKRLPSRPGGQIMALVNAAINRDSKTRVSITDPQAYRQTQSLHQREFSDYDAKAVRSELAAAAWSK